MPGKNGISPSALTRETQAISDQMGIPVVIVLADRGFGIFWPQRETKRCMATPSAESGDDMIELLLAENPNFRKQPDSFCSQLINPRPALRDLSWP